MSRLIRIGLCLLISSLAVAGLQAQPRCDDGIRPAPCGGKAAKGSCCCCPSPASCTCQAPTKAPAPPSDHAAAVPASAHALDDLAVLVHAPLVAVPPVETSIAAANSHPIQVHPEKNLARLHVLQV